MSRKRKLLFWFWQLCKHSYFSVYLQSRGKLNKTVSTADNSCFRICFAFAHFQEGEQDTMQAEDVDINTIPD
jgi:hypothetical protein